jgi:hypothetical protein
MLWNFVNIISPFVAVVGNVYSLRMVYFYRNVSEQCLYYLYVFDVVQLGGIINEYIYQNARNGQL